MEIASLTFAVVGSVELVKRVFGKDYQSVAIIVVSAVVGALFASQVDVSWFNGLVLGLGASGLITTASKLGGN